MSDESKPPVNPQPAAAAAPEPIPAGKYGQLLESQKFAVTHLGPDAKGTERIEVSADALLEVAQILRDHPQARFDFLVLVTGVDMKTHRESLYHVYSTETFDSLMLKVKAENDRVPSVMPIWPAADWHERESYDLMGIIYDGHPNLERILMPNDWLGHPLRKDYKVDDPRLIWNER